MSEQILQFSAEYKSKTIMLSEQNKCAEVVECRGFCYVIANAKPIKKGVHCWRVKVSFVIYLIFHVMDNKFGIINSMNI